MGFELVVGIGVQGGGEETHLLQEPGEEIIKTANSAMVSTPNWFKPPKPFSVILVPQQARVCSNPVCYPHCFGGEGILFVVVKGPRLAVLQGIDHKTKTLACSFGKDRLSSLRGLSPGPRGRFRHFSSS